MPQKSSLTSLDLEPVASHSPYEPIDTSTFVRNPSSIGANKRVETVPFARSHTPNPTIDPNAQIMSGLDAIKQGRYNQSNDNQADKGVFGPSSLPDFTYRVGETPIIDMAQLGMGHAPTGSWMGPSGGTGQAVTRFLSKGVPNQAARELSTAQFVRDAAILYGPQFGAQAAKFADEYPRVAGHINLKPNPLYPEMSNFGEGGRGITRMVRYEDAGIKKDAAGNAYGPTFDVRFNPEQNKTAEDMREVIYHEGTHVAQGLGDPSANELYSLGEDMIGSRNPITNYLFNPRERSAQRRGIKEKIGMSDSLYRDFVKNPELFQHHPTAKQNPRLIMPKGSTNKGLKSISKDVIDNPRMDAINPTPESRIQYIAALRTNSIQRMKEKPPQVGQAVEFAKITPQGLEFDKRILNNADEVKEFNNMVRKGSWFLNPDHPY